MIEKCISNALKTGEGYHLEFKQSVDKSFIEEACAFANSSGGKILVGVADDNTIKPTKIGNSNLSRIQATLEQIEPRLEISVEVVNGIIVVDVPEGTDKPYGCSKGFFMRVGANSQKLKRNEIIEFFQKEGRIRFATLKNRKAEIDKDFDPQAFNRFLQLSGISPSIDHDSLLQNLDCLTDDHILTNAGVLFFTKTIDFILENAMVVCVLYQGNQKLNILDKKDFKTNILENIDNAILFVQRHTNLEYKIDKIRREEIPDIPESALREAIVNAVCHRDYFDKGSNVLIEVFSDKVVISNPGGLPSGLKAKDFGKRSVSRNPLIASLLHRADYIEKIGTGITRIKQAVKENMKSTVDFYYDASKFVVTFNKGEGVKLDDDSGSESDLKLKTEKYLNKQTLIVLEAVKENPGIQAPELSTKLNRPIDTVKKQIKKLIDSGLMERRGSKKSGGYWANE